MSKYNQDCSTDFLKDSENTNQNNQDRFIDFLEYSEDTNQNNQDSVLKELKEKGDDTDFLIWHHYKILKLNPNNHLNTGFDEGATYDKYVAAQSYLNIGFDEDLFYKEYIAQNYSDIQLSFILSGFNYWLYNSKNE